MAAKKEPKVAAGGDLTPHSDAESDAESSLSGVSVADIAAALRAAGVVTSKETQDRSFARDVTDVDIGYHEYLRLLMANRATSLTALSNAFDHVKAVKAMDAQTLANFENNANAFWGMLSKASSTFHNGLTQAYGLETDNEVLSTATLAKLIEALNKAADEE